MVAYPNGITVFCFVKVRDARASTAASRFQLLTDREGSYPLSVNGTAKSAVGNGPDGANGHLSPPVGTPPQATSPSPGSP